MIDSSQQLKDTTLIRIYATFIMQYVADGIESFFHAGADPTFQITGVGVQDKKGHHNIMKKTK